MRNLISFLLFLSLLAACVPAAAPLATAQPAQPSASPTTPATASPVPATETVPQIASPTPPFATAQPMLTEQPTPDVPATLAAAATPVVLETADSPDGAWRAEFTRYDCTLLGTDTYSFERLELVNQSDGSRKELATQLIACGGLGAFGLGSLGWSNNSRFFYYTDARQGQPDGMACYWERPMYAYDVPSDEVVLLKEGPASPDGSRIAINLDNQLVIWDRSQGEIARLEPSMAGYAIGARSWSPDGQQLAYLQTEDACPPYGRSVLALITLSDLSQENFFQDDNLGFQGVEWREPRSIFLFAEDGKAWRLDPDTGEVTRAGD